MDDSTYTTESAPTGPARKKRGRGLLWAVLAVVIAFFAGFLWQFYEATTVRQQLTETEQELALERLRIRLGQAALAAQAGNYESARQQMSEFFTRLQQGTATMPDDVQRVATNFLSMRDEIITGLSRSNPEYGGVLYGMLEELADAIGPSAGALPGEAAGGPTAPVEERPAADSEGAAPGELAPEPAAGGAPGGDSTGMP